MAACIDRYSNSVYNFIQYLRTSLHTGKELSMKHAKTTAGQKPSPISRFRPGDAILLSAALILALLLYFGYRFFFQKPGAAVEITINGTATKTLPLSENTSYRIITESQGKSHENVLEIKDGHASITRADCPDKLCVYQKKISKKGETLVCLPHKVLVSVISSDKNSDIDSIAH